MRFVVELELERHGGQPPAGAVRDALRTALEDCGPEVPLGDGVLPATFDVRVITLDGPYGPPVPDEQRNRVLAQAAREVELRAARAGRW